VDEVAAYRAVAPDEGEMASVREKLESGGIDWVTFTASSTVRNFVSALGADVGSARVAAIGPITAGTARELGLRVDVEAEEYTIPGLVDALVRAVVGDDREAA
jgi:uroporphyrinogen III methyltransferase/synthase